MDLACTLAAEARAVVTLVSAIEVPAELPLDSHMLSEEVAGRQALAEAQATADSYGLASSAKLVRGREAGEEIVREAIRSRSEIIILSAQRNLGNPRAPIFGTTVEFVLKHAPCRVMVAAQAAEQ
jgi:nucleotide-binding universal stress UspA family protein